MFARNWGDEGYCSQRHHPLPRGTLTVRIPWLNRAVGVGDGALARPASRVEITDTSDLWSNIPSPFAHMSISVIPGQAILVSYDLSRDPAGEPAYWGTIGVKWSFDPPQATTAPPAAVPPVLAPQPAPADEGEKNDVEAIARRLFRRLKPAVRAKALASIPYTPTKVRARRVAVSVASPPLAPLRRAGEAAVEPTVDRRWTAIGATQRKALCVAYKGKVPEVQKAGRSFCRGVPSR